MPKELRAWPKLTARLGTLAPRSLHREVCFINITGAPECPEKRTVSWDEMNSLSLSLLQLQRIRTCFRSGILLFYLHVYLPLVKSFSLWWIINNLMMIRNSVFQRFIEKIHTDILGKAFCKLRYLQISKNNWEHACKN